jgi:hypothetical protein
MSNPKQIQCQMMKLKRKKYQLRKTKKPSKQNFKIWIMRIRQLNKWPIGKHHATQFQNNLILKGRAKKILNLRRETLRKSSQPAKLV